jgi:hypothetical protein
VVLTQFSAPITFLGFLYNVALSGGVLVMAAFNLSGMISALSKEFFQLL